MYYPPKNDIELSRHRLDIILERRRLRFNPYRVSNKKLLEYAWQGTWGNTDDLTQMVVMRFCRLREVDDCRRYDGLYIRIGNAEEEFFIARKRFIEPVTAHDTLKQTRSIYGSCTICNDKDILNLVGKTVFISRIIHGYTIQGSGTAAYRMHRLWHEPEKNAATIRQAMCEAKIEMLQRLMDYPESPLHLSCSKGFFDYETPIRQAMEAIRRYSDTPVPED